MTRIVDSVLVDEDRANQSTELNQHMPVTAISSETRSLDREHGTDIARADSSDQTIEPRSGGPATGAAKVIINYLDARPAELTGTIGERILAMPALVIVCKLIG